MYLIAVYNTRSVRKWAQKTEIRQERWHMTNAEKL